jgi:hypothetical protein
VTKPKTLKVLNKMGNRFGSYEVVEHSGDNAIVRTFLMGNKDLPYLSLVHRTKRTPTSKSKVWKIDGSAHESSGNLNIYKKIIAVRNAMKEKK